VVGNSEVDMIAAKGAGCRGIKISRDGNGDISSLWELKNIL
jgi:acid phosphatase class B